MAYSDHPAPPTPHTLKRAGDSLALLRLTGAAAVAAFVLLMALFAGSPPDDVPAPAASGAARR